MFIMGVFGRVRIIPFRHFEAGVHTDKGPMLEQAEAIEHNDRDVAPTPIRISVLKEWLEISSYPDANILLSGFQDGFRLCYNGPRHSRIARNLKSITKYPGVALQKIDKELKLGRIAGPFVKEPFDNFQSSPIGLVPKKAEGEFRLIHHLSYPENMSINDFIDPVLCSVRYTEFDEAINMIQDLGRNCYLFKMDIKSAFRLLPVNPLDFELLGFSLDGCFYYDKCLPFGCSISPSLFEKFSTFLEYCIRQRLVNGLLIHYLDDFLGGDKSESGCKENMAIFKDSMEEIGVPLADEKTEGPCQVLVFLGLELDSREMVVRIPSDKIKEVVEKIQGVISKKSATLKQLQSLIGSLNFCCRAIAIGRPFCRRLINLTCGVTRPHHHVRLNKQVKTDLDLWLGFFKHFNGISVFHDRFWVTNDDLELYTDSSGGVGFGIWFQGRWCQDKWPTEWHTLGITSDITCLELFPIVVAVVVFGDHLVNKKIRINCDNKAVVHILNTMTSKNTRVLALLRFLTIQCVKRNCIIKASHIEGIKNEIADALSRFQNHRFRSLVEQADPEATPMPNYLWNIFNLELDNWYLREFR